jgi:hypothetical protein
MNTPLKGFIGRLSPRIDTENPIDGAISEGGRANQKYPDIRPAGSPAYSPGQEYNAEQIADDSIKSSNVIVHFEASIASCNSPA